MRQDKSVVAEEIIHDFRISTALCNSLLKSQQSDALVIAARQIRADRIIESLNLHVNRLDFIANSIAFDALISGFKITQQLTNPRCSEIISLGKLCNVLLIVCRICFSQGLHQCKLIFCQTIILIQVPRHECKNRYLKVMHFLNIKIVNEDNHRLLVRVDITINIE